MPKKKDLTGQKFGRLTVIKEQGRNKNKKFSGCVDANVVLKSL